MASTAGASKQLRGKVKAVPSGDTLVIVGNGISKDGFPPEKTITLSSIMAPRLARRDGVDEPFAWDSREYLRKLCIGKEVLFQVDYKISPNPPVEKEFGSVFLGGKNVAFMVVAGGWAKVREPSQQKPEEASPHLHELQGLEVQSKQQGVGRWNQTPGAAEASIRNLPPSAVGESSNFDAMGLLAANKGKPMEAIVEQVRDGSCLRVLLLPEYQFVQVFVAGIQAPSMGRRQSPVVPETTADEANGETSAESSGPLTSAQRLAASSSVSFTESPPEPFSREGKHFTEIRVLSRDVRIVLEGVDKYNNLIGSVYYPDGESAKDLAMELVKHGLAKYVEWSASMLEDDAKRRLKSAELEAKKSRLRIWKDYVPPASNSKAIHDQNFTGKVVEVVSGDCIIVADDSLPFGSLSAERRVNLSSIKCPRLGNPRREDKVNIPPYAREAKEFLRTRLIGRQVQVSMEYSRKVNLVEGASAPTGPADRVMDFGSVFLLSPAKDGENAVPAAPSAVSQQPGANVAELVISRGFGEVVRHRDLEVRSNYYDALLAAESRARASKKGMHSGKDAPVTHVTDLLTASAKKARDFLPFLQRNRRMTAVVEYVLSGHRFKLYIPKETCTIAFSLSGVRCPGRTEHYSEDAIALMRRKIMQRDVEIEVETCDRTGTFLGSVWESKSNVALMLLEAGLAKLQTSFGADRIPDVNLLSQAEQSAKKQKLKIWEDYVEGEEVPSGPAIERKKNEYKVVVTEVLGGGKFYVQAVADQQVSSIQQQLASLKLREAPVIGSFNPKKGDLVLAQFSADNSWNRAMIVNTPPRGAVESAKDNFEVFYIDYGNQEVVAYSQLRPRDPSVSSLGPLAQLCSLAYVKIPGLEEDYGQEAAIRLSEHILNVSKEFTAVIVEKDTSGGKVKGQGSGPIQMVTLVEPEANTSINAVMLKEGLARLEKRRKYEAPDRKQAIDELQKDQEEARRMRLGMWEYGDIMSDDEDNGPPVRKAAGKR